MNTQAIEVKTAEELTRMGGRHYVHDGQCYCDTGSASWRWRGDVFVRVDDGGRDVQRTQRDDRVTTAAVPRDPWRPATWMIRRRVAV